jgi:hypothetical protein
MNKNYEKDEGFEWFLGWVGREFQGKTRGECSERIFSN